MRTATTKEVRKVLRENFNLKVDFTTKVVDPNVRIFGCYLNRIDATNTTRVADEVRNKLVELGFDNHVYTTGDCYVRVKAVMA